MRILWFSNAVISDVDRAYTGTWLHALARRLVDSNRVTLANISSGQVKEITRRDCGPICQWIAPRSRLSAETGLPAPQIVSGILKAVDEFAPDVVHVWGVESFAGLLTARRYISRPALLEMQGLKGAVAEHFAGGLTPAEQSECRGLKEILLGRSIRKTAAEYSDWARFECEIIAGHRHVATQTEWIRARVAAIRPSFADHHTDLILRHAFYASPPWEPYPDPTVFCSAAYSSPFKGLHVAIRACALLLKRFPNLRLRIAGAHQGRGIRKDGYIAWVQRLAQRLGIVENVTWLGPLDGPQIAAELRAVSAMVLPSFVENCSTSMQEAMMIGTPVVASCAGGLPSLARDEESALFFPRGDHLMCASQIARLLGGVGLPSLLSINARSLAFRRNDPATVIDNQISIYERVIADYKKEVPA